MDTPIPHETEQLLHCVSSILHEDCSVAGDSLSAQHMVSLYRSYFKPAKLTLSFPYSGVAYSF